MNQKKFLLITGFFTLFFLILLNILIFGSKRNQKIQPSPTPTPLSRNFEGYSSQNKIKKNPMPFFLSEIEKNLQDPQTSQKFSQLAQQTPNDTENFVVNYFPLSNELVLTPKNLNGYEDINIFLKSQGFDLNNLPSFVTILNLEDLKSRLYEEEELFMIRDKNLRIEETATLEANLEPTTISTEESDPGIETLRNFLRLFFISSNMEIKNPNPTIEIDSKPKSVPKNLPNLDSPAYSSLSQILDEVSKNVGVPKKIIEAVLFIESPSVFNWSPEKIDEYSKPENFDPKCIPNECSATGPMQISIGVDHSGSSLCSSCQAKISRCPNAWNTVSRAVNIFTPSQHQPNPCNLKDSLYAAAFKLKTDSKATNSDNWTKDEVFLAGERYHGSCKDKFRYPRLGNRTYCEFLWDYYRNNL